MNPSLAKLETRQNQGRTRRSKREEGGKRGTQAFRGILDWIERKLVLTKIPTAYLPSSYLLRQDLTKLGTHLLANLLSFSLKLLAVWNEKPRVNGWPRGGLMTYL